MVAQTDNLWNELLENHSEPLNDWFDKRFDERFISQMERTQSEKVPSLSLMVTKGTLDWAYPPFIIASTATALGWKVTMFFTFYGLALLKKELALQISPLGNPAMPMHMPFGPKWFREVEWKIPNLIMAGVPGFEHMATAMMKKTIAQKGVAPIEELRAICIESGVKFIGCQMTVDLFGWHRDEFIPEIEEWAGAASYLAVARESNTCLLI
ncbi:MAG: DsrE/DsrF/DrsH-like family protein [Gammaproteobacteria bacterium]|jgi:peroxiredoxin family protein